MVEEDFVCQKLLLLQVAFSVVADVSKQAEVAAAFQKVVDHFGDLNVVVNNAGVAPTKSLDTITEE